MGGDGVITVYEGDKFALCRVNPRITCRTQPLMRLVDYTYPPVTSGPIIAEGRTSVWRAIVHQNHLHLSHILGYHTPHAPVQRVGRPINRNHHR